MFNLLLALATIWTQNNSAYWSLPMDVKAASEELSPTAMVATQTVVSQSPLIKVRRNSDVYQRFAAKGIALKGLQNYGKPEKADNQVVDNCAQKLENVIGRLPLRAKHKLKDLTLYFSNEGRRGLGGGNTIVLRCTNVTDQELIGVLIHELGHLEDGSVLVGSEQSGESNFLDGTRPVYNDDPSLQFYRLSFIDEETLKHNSVETDFVSGYAMSDPFEDFAETYLFYFLHGNRFRHLAQNQPILAQKYAFMKEQVFNGEEYSFDDQFEPDSALFALLSEQRNYDATILTYNYEKLLAF